MTLVELLVVISILMLLAVVSVRAMRPAIEDARIREAARMVNVYLGAARNRAQESGRPYGVEIERVASQPLAGITLYQVEVPPPYAGDFQDSRIAIVSGGVVSFSRGEDPYTPGLIRPGDMLKLNYQGHVWVIQYNIGAPSIWTFSSATASAPPVTPAEGVPFQVFRQPVRTAIAPLQLPRGTAIDLAWSGATIQLFRPGTLTDVSPVRIMFSPNGSLDRLWASGFPEGSRVIEPIYLLIGRRDRVPLERAAPFTSPAEDGRANLEEPSNLWVAVQPQTGSTITEKVADTGAIPWTQEALKIAVAREFATEGRAMEGR